MRSAFVTVSFGLLTLPRGIACSCSPLASAPGCQLIASTPVVFLGTVTAIEPDPMWPRAPRARIYRFRVERAYKGLDPKTTSILVDPDNLTTCGTAYRAGGKYIIFGGGSPRDKSVVMSSQCSGSRLAANYPDDVRFLDQYSDGKSITKISGRVVQWLGRIGWPDPEEIASVPQAVVTLEAYGFKQELSSGLSGQFTFAPVKPGSYRLTAESKGYGTVTSSVQVDAGACTEAFPVLPGRATIAGTVRTSDDKPAAKKRVELVRRSDSGKWYSTYQFWATSKTDGSFEFNELPTGDYLLGHEIWHDRPSQSSPYPVSYFPGVPLREEAEVISVLPGQRRDGLALRLDPPHKERPIHVEVVWPGGQPARENLLQLFDRLALIQNIGGSIRGVTSPHSGVFDFTGYEERSYTLNARYWVDDLGSDVPQGQQRISFTNQVELKPGKGPASVRLVLGPIRGVEE
ncbi:MAG TPA: carboxypeptidase regulatory-like domain-containing protein [Bryobacteraceae bacterium]|nr:carboxypeptidase regulatory-like domain-containing protein [Bryobacteraceae bacterium]